MLRYIPRQILYLTGKEIIASYFPTREHRWIDQFRSGLCRYFDVSHAACYPSCMKLLDTTLAYYGISSGDEIILPVYTYKGIYETILERGIVPRFADVDTTMNLDPLEAKRAITKRTKAIIVPHHSGSMCNMETLIQTIPKNIKVIEDFSQSFGATHNGKYAGTFGDIGICSCGRGKYFDLMGGGIAITDNKRLAEYLRAHETHRVRPLTQLKISLRYTHLLLSTNQAIGFFTTYPFQLVSRKLIKKDTSQKIISKSFEKARPEGFDPFRAKLGLKRLERIKGIINKQRKHADRYDSYLGTHAVPKSPGHSALYYPIRATDTLKLIMKGIDTKEDFCDLLKTGYPQAESFNQKVLYLPVFHALSEKDISYITTKLSDIIPAR
ncbi:MAG: DegT/DnrJ/EryC1/StrS family aminotransferase [Nanobdellota archaeon]